MKRCIWALLLAAVIWAACLLVWRVRPASHTPAPVDGGVYARRAQHAKTGARIASIAELVRRKDDTAVRTLSRMLEKDKDSFFRSRAAWGLGRIARKSALPRLARALEDESYKVFSSACWAIGRIGDPAGAESLRPYALKKGDNRRIRDATWALGDIRAKQAEEILLQRLDYPLSEVTVLAVAALSKNGTERALARLKEMRPSLPADPELDGEAPFRPDLIEHEVAIAVDAAIEALERRLGKKN